ncbi:MAG: mechanosensitive ion channel [Spirochaetaceae bacterium]|nr:mechanosensitive ion channel [Spirochaetaceae bacterium]
MKKKFFLLTFFVTAFLPAVYGQDAGSAGATDGGITGELEAGATSIEKVIEEKIQDAVNVRGKFFAKENYGFFVRLGIAAVIAIAQIVLILLTFRLATAITKKAHVYGKAHFRPIKIKNIVLMDVEQMIKVSVWLISVLKLVVSLFQLVITIPIIFHFFEATRNIATKLFNYILTPLKQFVFGVINYIPNLFAIAVILIISRYILRMLKFFSNQIEHKKLVIPGFYPEWATPTFNILRVLVYAFTIAFIYPYLPNSESDIFKGISVLVGVLFSLGSSSVISNLIAGIVMTYMRPFQIGDRIKIHDVTGFVVERGPMNTRIRTHKNEFVSFPNQMILNTSVVNFNWSTTAGLDGYIVHVPVTMGYDVPWRTVHEILVNAALKTENTEKTPPPYVNQTKLDDFYCWYEINVYTKKIDMLPVIYSGLYKNIQDGFTAANISMYAPHYEVYTQQIAQS